MAYGNPGTPGIKTERTATPRIVFVAGTQTQYLPSSKIIDGDKARDPLNTNDEEYLRPGLLLGKITASGKYGASIIGVTSGAEAAGQTEIGTSAAVAAELFRRIGNSGTFKLIGPAVADGVIQEETVTYSNVNTTTGAITCTAISNNFVAGSYICPTDGSEYPLTILPDGYPLKVTDDDEEGTDTQFAKVPISGVIDSTQIVNWSTSDDALQAWVMDHLNHFIFDHEF